MGFTEFHNLISKGYEDNLPTDIKIPEYDCPNCKKQQWNVGLSAISCGICGYVVILWHVPSKMMLKLIDMKKRNKEILNRNFKGTV